MFQEFPQSQQVYTLQNFISKVLPDFEVQIDESIDMITFDNNKEFREIVENVENGIYDGDPESIAEDIREFLEFEKLDEAAKDISRLEGIKTKSKGNLNKAAQLARAMANKIKDKNKAYARGQAAIQVFGDDGGELARIFFDKAAELGMKIDKSEYQDLKVKVTPMPFSMMKGKELADAKKQQAGAYEAKPGGRYSRYGGSPILPVGSINFITGQCKYFNVYETWGDSTMEIWQTENGKYRAICTAGSSSKVGSISDFSHDQTGRYMFSGVLVDFVKVEGMMNLVDKYGRSMPGYTYK